MRWLHPGSSDRSKSEPEYICAYVLIEKGKDLIEELNVPSLTFTCLPRLCGYCIGWNVVIVAMLDPLINLHNGIN